MSKFLDQITSTIQISPLLNDDEIDEKSEITTEPLHSSNTGCTSISNDAETWKNTICTTVCIPDIDHVRVTSSITQKKQNETALCYPGGKMLRSKISWQVENSIDAIRECEKRMENDSRFHSRAMMEKRKVKETKRCAGGWRKRDMQVVNNGRNG